jgi:hypothetical protein
LYQVRLWKKFSKHYDKRTDGTVGNRSTTKWNFIIEVSSLKMIAMISSLFHERFYAIVRIKKIEKKKNQRPSDHFDFT